MCSKNSIFRENIYPMNKCLLLGLLLFTGLTGFSQQGYKQKTIDLIKLSSAAQFDVLIQPLVEMVPEENQAAFKAEIRTSMEDLYEQLSVIYMDLYTEEDVDAILNFYNSPVGKKMIKITPEITEKSLELGQIWGMQLQPLLAKYSN